MIVTVSLTGDAENQLRASIERGDSESVRRLLVEAIAPTVESLLRRPPSEELTDEEFERLADQLAFAPGDSRFAPPVRTLLSSRTSPPAPNRTTAGE